MVSGIAVIERLLKGYWKVIGRLLVESTGVTV
jgi:hypothetical protein